MADVRAPENESSAALAATDFYAEAMRMLDEAGVPFLVGGAYAFERLTGVDRETEDFDLFLREKDLARALEALADAGYETDITYPHWLAKVHHDGRSIDLIYRSGNGVAQVDDRWFERAVPGEVLGRPAKLCPAEEILWTKAFIMERERFDGADVVHLVRCRSRELAWDRLLELFGEDWRVLLAHVVLYGFVYPSHRDDVPADVVNGLLARLHEERQAPYDGPKSCRGTLLSRAQYLIDVDQWGYRDARLWPEGGMMPHQVDTWTDAIEEE